MDIEPSKITSARSESPHVEAGPAGPGFKEHDFGILGKWRLPSGAVSESLDDMELAKYALIASENREKFLPIVGNLPPHLLYKWITRPDWVKRLESKEHLVLVPFYDTSGTLKWKGIGSRR